MSVEKLRNDAHKLKEVFVDTIKFAINRDLVNSLYNLIILRDFHNKVGIFKIGVNDIIETENAELKHKKISELLNLIVTLGKSLEEILLGLSHLEIRKQLNLNPLVLETYEDMTDSEKIEQMLVLIHWGLELHGVFR